MRLTLCVMVFAFVAVIAAACFSVGGKNASPSANCLGPKETLDGELLIGDCTMYDEKSNTVQFSDFRGEYLFVNFWASWCPYCQKEMPAMEQVWLERKSGTFQMLAVSLPMRGETEEAAKDFFFTQHDFTYHFAFDRDGKMSALYDVRSIPMSYLVDRDGVVQAVIIGSRTWTSPGCQNLFDAVMADEELTRGLIRGCR